MAAGSPQGYGGVDAARTDLPARPFLGQRRLDELPRDARADPQAAVALPLGAAKRGTRSGRRAAGGFQADEQPFGSDAVLACARTAALSCFLLKVTGGYWRDIHCLAFAAATWPPGAEGAGVTMRY